MQVATTANNGATALLDALGEDLVFSWVELGESQLQIGKRIGCSGAMVGVWASKIPERYVRYRMALSVGAEHFEQEADRYLAQAHLDALANPLVASALVSVARERAQGAWRRAAVRDPVRYDANRAARADVTVNVDARRVERIEVLHVSPPPRSEVTKNTPASLGPPPVLIACRNSENSDISEIFENPTGTPEVITE